MKKPMRDVGDDYLWDQSGEPDPEIQELEQMLGTLRYQPRPLEIPEGLQPGRQRFAIRDFKPHLAIAAGIALVVLGAGLWLGLERQDPSAIATTETTVPATDNANRAAVIVPEDVLERVSEDRGDNVEKPVAVLIKDLKKTRRNQFNQTTVAANTNPPRAPEATTPELDANELKQAEAGKAQLMLALRVASAKLNLAIKKTQGTNNPNQIHNQHKVG